MQRARVVEQVAAQPGVTLDQGGEHFADGRALDRDGRLTVGLGAQHGGKLDLDGHAGRLQPDPSSQDSGRLFAARDSVTVELDRDFGDLAVTNAIRPQHRCAWSRSDTIT